MNRVVVVLAFWSAVAVQARPGTLFGGGDLLGGGGGGDSYGLGGGGGIGSGYGGGGGGGGNGGGTVQLSGVPSNFEVNLPTYDIQDLGTVYEGQIPSQTIKVTNAIALKIPKPYPVKVSQPFPVPISVPKPYPVPVTKIVTVPQTVPVEVIKKVPVPIEVPKPYPVPSSELGQSQGGVSGGLDGFGGGFGGHQQLSQSYEIPHTSYGEPIQGGSLGGGGFDSYASQSQDSGYDSSAGQEDQSAGYPAVAAASDNQEQQLFEHGAQ